MAELTNQNMIANPANPFSYITQTNEWRQFHDENVRCVQRIGRGRCYHERLPGSTLCETHQPAPEPKPTPVKKATPKPAQPKKAEPQKAPPKGKKK